MLCSVAVNSADCKIVCCVQIQVRLQRPTVVAEVGFMLSVTKFFVPGFAMSGLSPTPFESNDVVLQGNFPHSLSIWLVWSKPRCGM